jgi:ribosome maturation protein Sdo1
MVELIPLSEIKKALAADANFQILPASQKNQIIQRLEGIAVNPNYRGRIPANILKQDLKQLRVKSSGGIRFSTIEKVEKAIKPLLEKGPGLRKIG